jgi:hypothetical protein
LRDSGLPEIVNQEAEIWNKRKNEGYQSDGKPENGDLRRPGFGRRGSPVRFSRPESAEFKRKKSETDQHGHIKYPAVVKLDHNRCEQPDWKKEPGRPMGPYYHEHERDYEKEHNIRLPDFPAEDYQVWRQREKKNAQEELLMVPGKFRKKEKAKKQYENIRCQDERG